MSDIRRHDGGDEAVTDLLREIYAPPADPAYWAGLEARVLARVRSGAEPVAEWWQVLDGWARVGAAAALLAALASSAALLQSRADEARVAYETVVETTPALPLTMLARTSGRPAAYEREATLHYVISH